MHGFLESSNGWIVLGSENSIGKSSFVSDKKRLLTSIVIQLIYLLMLAMMFGWATQEVQKRHVHMSL